MEEELNQERTRTIRCPLCLGKSKVKLHNPGPKGKQVIACPACHGARSVHIETPELQKTAHIKNLKFKLRLRPKLLTLQELIEQSLLDNAKYQFCFCKENESCRCAKFPWENIDPNGDLTECKAPVKARSIEKDPLKLFAEFEPNFTRTGKPILWHLYRFRNRYQEFLRFLDCNGYLEAKENLIRLMDESKSENKKYWANMEGWWNLRWPHRSFSAPP